MQKYVIANQSNNCTDTRDSAKTCQSIYQSINQTTNQLTNPSIQSINQPTNSINQPTNQLTNQFNQPTNQPTNQSINQLIVQTSQSLLNHIHLSICGNSCHRLALQINLPLNCRHLWSKKITKKLNSNSVSECFKIDL